MPELGCFRSVAGGYEATSHHLYATSRHVETKKAIPNKQARVDGTWTDVAPNGPDVRTSDRIIFEVRALLIKVRIRVLILIRALHIMRIRIEVRFQYAYYVLHTYGSRASLCVCV